MLGFDAIWFVIGLPLLGFLVQALAGKAVMQALGDKFGKWAMGALAVAPVAIAFLIAVGITRNLAGLPEEARHSVETLFYWIDIQSITLPFEVRVDALSMTMTLIITGVGSLIHLYATGYMAGDREYTRFFTYLNLFIAFMLVLVLGNNLALLFIGWEGVGVCSYLLIGFYYKGIDNAKAANKAFIVNRIGDYGLTLGMFLLVVLLASNQGALGVEDGRWLSYDVMLENKSAFLGVLGANPGVTTAIALLLFVGAMGKSAQFPLYIWLPDAMAGPTPVSALIHAATMVTSGVYLLNRMYIIFAESATAMAVVAVIGAVTALLGALIAFGQTDIKKVLAFSTVSQLGYMFMACGVGVFWAGIFHVTTHAFFKALLFLGSGAVIHAMAHEQDMRFYGNLRKYIPITFATMFIGWAAIAGFPLLSGFSSKEAILAGGFDYTANWTGQLVGWVGLGVAALTAAYMTRMTWLTFLSGEERWKTLAKAEHGHNDEHLDLAAEPASDPNDFFYSDAELAAQQHGADEHHGLDTSHKPHEVPWTMWVPLAVLAVASIFGGIALHKTLGIHLGGFDLKAWLYPEKAHGHVEHTMPLAVMVGLSLTAFVVGSAWATWRYFRSLPANEGLDMKQWPVFLRLSNKQFGIDRALNDGSVSGGGILGNVSAMLDKRLVDGLVNAVGAVVYVFGAIFGKLQTGFVRSYAVVMMLGVLGLVGWISYILLSGATP